MVLLANQVAAQSYWVKHILQGLHSNYWIMVTAILVNKTLAPLLTSVYPLCSLCRLDTATPSYSERHGLDRGLGHYDLVPALAFGEANVTVGKCIQVVGLSSRYSCAAGPAEERQFSRPLN